MWHPRLWNRPGAAGGDFEAVPPQIPPCTHQARNVPTKRGLCPKERNRPGATEVHFGICAFPSVSKVSFQDQNYEWTPRRSLWLRAEDLFFFLVFIAEFVGKNRDPHYKILLPPARLGTCPPERELCTERRRTVRIYGAQFGIKTFFLVFTSEFEENIYLGPPKHFFYPPPQLRYFGAGPAPKIFIHGAQKARHSEAICGCQINFFIIIVALRRSV